MRRTVSFALVLIVLLAGCSAPILGGGGNSTSGPDASDNATSLPGESGDATPESDDSERSIEEPPLGVSADGAVNETELLRATTSAMNDSVVRIDHRNGNDSAVVVQSPESTYSRDDFGVVWSSSHTSIDNDSLGDAEYSLRYRRNTTTQIRADSSMQFALVVRLSSGEYEHAGTETVDGQRLHRLEMVQPTGMGTAVEHYEATALVDGEGRLHRLAGEVGDSEANATSFEFAFDWSVETVPEPSWAERVPRVEANKTADGSALAVSVRQGPPIPADATFEFYHDGLEGEVTLSESLDPGDTLYVGYNGSSETRQVVSDRRPLEADGLRSLQGDQTSFDGTLTLGDGTVVWIDVNVGSIDFGS